MDPVLLILFVGGIGVVVSIVSMRRSLDEGATLRLADRRSVLVGGALIVVAAVVAFVLLMDTMG
jgi:hypothetical protein